MQLSEQKNMLSTQQRPPVQNLGSQNLLAHGEWIAKKWSGKTFAAEMQNELPAHSLSLSKRKEKEIWKELRRSFFTHVGRRSV